MEQAEKRMAPAERRMTEVERRTRTVEIDQTEPGERVYRDDYTGPEDPPFPYRQVRPYAPPPAYADEPSEMRPAPFAPPWYYGRRSLAWGPYPGMRAPPPGAW
jgi:hypothetical protein